MDESTWTSRFSASNSAFCNTSAVVLLCYWSKNRGGSDVISLLCSPSFRTHFSRQFSCFSAVRKKTNNPEWHCVISNPKSTTSDIVSNRDNDEKNENDYVQIIETFQHFLGAASHLFCSGRRTWACSWLSAAFKHGFPKTVAVVVLSSRASLLSQAAASFRGNLLQAPSLIIRELLHSDSLGSFLSLLLHVCPLIPPSSQPSSHQSAPIQNAGFLLAANLLRVGRETLWLHKSTLCLCFLIHIHLFPSSFY